MRKPILTAILTLTLVALPVAAASAAIVHPLLSTFDSGSSHSGLAVDQVNGDVFAANDYGEKIEIFGESGGLPAGGIPSEITGVESPSGSFHMGAEYDLAVDSSGGPSSGDMYIVTESGYPSLSSVDKYRFNPISEEYEYLCQFTGYSQDGGLACYKNEPTVEQTPEVRFPELGLSVAVDEQGNLYAMPSRGGSIYEFNAAGEDVREIPPPASLEYRGALAIDAAGNIYVSARNYPDDPSPTSVIEIERNPAGEPIAESTVVTEGAYTLALDNATDTLFVGLVRPLPASPKNYFVAEYDAAHGLTSEFGSGVLRLAEGIAEFPSLAVNFRTGEIYVSNDALDRIEGYAPVEAQTKPAVQVQSTTSLTPRAALLGATIDPGLAATTFHFVYGPTGAYGLSAPAREVEVASSGDLGVVVQPVSLEGLQPETTYHYAVVATNEFGQTYGPDQTFTTPPAPLAEVQTGVAEDVAQNAAVISGGVDAEGLPTTYEFDLGTDTSYGSRVFGNAGSGSEDRVFSLNLTGLQPATTYHYRLVATNTYGTSYGSDRTFTTAGFPTTALTAPPTPALLAVPAISFPTATTTVAAKQPATKKPAGKKKRRKSKKKRKKAKRAASIVRAKQQRKGM